MTFAGLKKRVYMALDLYSVNGAPITASSGIKADIAARMTAMLNFAMQRIRPHFPLYEKEISLTLSEEEDGARCAVLPPDAVGGIICIRDAKGYSPEKNRVSTANGVLRITDARLDDAVTVRYRVMPWFRDDMPEETPILLPPLTLEAVIVLGAAALCPSESDELYRRLNTAYLSLCSESPGAISPDRVADGIFRHRGRGLCRV